MKIAEYTNSIETFHVNYEKTEKLCDVSRYVEIWRFCIHEVGYMSAVPWVTDENVNCVPAIRETSAQPYGML